MNTEKSESAIFTLFELFYSHLPKVNVRERMVTFNHAITQTPMSVRLINAITTLTQLTVFNGRGLLQGQPILLGCWRQGGQQDTAELLTGLREVLAYGNVDKECALAIATDCFVESGCSVRYFKLWRIKTEHIDADRRLAKSVMESLHWQAIELLENVEKKLAIHHCAA